MLAKKGSITVRHGMYDVVDSKAGRQTTGDLDAKGHA